jgi:hypothetical protein
MLKAKHVAVGIAVIVSSACHAWPSTELEQLLSQPPKAQKTSTPPQSSLPYQSNETFFCWNALSSALYWLRSNFSISLANQRRNPIQVTFHTRAYLGPAPEYRIMQNLEVVLHGRVDALYELSYPDDTKTFVVWKLTELHQMFGSGHPAVRPFNDLMALIQKKRAGEEPLTTPRNQRRGNVPLSEVDQIRYDEIIASFEDPSFVKELNRLIIRGIP